MLTLYIDELTPERTAEIRLLLNRSLTLRYIDEQILVIEQARVAQARLIGLRPCPIFGSSQTLADLTTKERQVLELLAQGLRNRQIGQILGISEKGVEKRVTSILIKLGLESRMQVILFLIHHKSRVSPRDISPEL